jgi:hypothetical protein
VRRTAWLLGLALAGCSGGGLSLSRIMPAGAPSGHEVRYTGALPGCGLAAATLTRRDDQFSFTPGDGVLTMLGTVAPDGGFSGSLNTQPPGKPPFLLSVTGRIAEEQATLDYATPRCRAAATFSRVHPSLL